MNLKRVCYFVTMSHENYITFNCNYVCIKHFNHHFNFCINKSFYYSTDNALLWKAFTDILNSFDIHFTYILFHMTNLLNSVISKHFWRTMNPEFLNEGLDSNSIPLARKKIGSNNKGIINIMSSCFHYFFLFFILYLFLLVFFISNIVINLDK